MTGHRTKDLRNGKTLGIVPDHNFNLLAPAELPLERKV
jgi:hypothetical protein